MPTLEIKGKRYREERADRECMCYKCALYEINICSPMPKCIGRNIVYAEVEQTPGYQMTIEEV